MHDFNGEMTECPDMMKDSSFCYQHQVEGSDYYFAVYPKESYVGVRNGELEIRLLQHQAYSQESEPKYNPEVAFERLSQQEFKHVNGLMKVGLTGNAMVTALRFSDNDTLARLWGNFIVRHPGTDDQQILALSSSEGNNEVWVDCLNGVRLSSDSSTYFVVALPPGAFYRGFALDVFNGDSLLFHIVTKEENSIQRAKMLPMPTIKIP